MKKELSRAMAVAYRLLAYRDRSTKEILTSLKKKETAENITEEVIKRLRELNYLNDKKFALTYGSSLARHKRVGPAYVKHKLREKGVAEIYIDEAIEEIYSDHRGMMKEIDSWIEKRMLRMKDSIPAIKKKKRLFDFLAGKGFTPDAIFKAMERWKF